MIDDIQSGHGYHRDIKPDKLIVAARTKYNNMVEDKTWGKVDPCDVKIMALTTKIELLEKTTSGQSTSAANVINGKTGGPSDSKFSVLEERHKKFDKDTKVDNGRTFWWCKHHKGRNGEYNGLYVSSHSPDMHEAWSKDKKNAKDGMYRNAVAANASASSNGDTSSNASAPKATLGLNDKLKQVLMTNVCLSAEDVDKRFKEAQEN